MSPPPHARRPALAWLCGMRVQRVDGPRPGCFVLALYGRGDKQFLVLMLGPGSRGVGAVRERPKGDAASAFVQRLRTAMEGARLTAAHWLESAAPAEAPHAAALELELERGGQPVRVVADFDLRAPNLFLLRADGSIAGAADERARRERFPSRELLYAPRASRGIRCSESEAELLAAGGSLLESQAERAEQSARARLEAEIRARLKRVTRRAEAIRGDLARGDDTPRLRREAELLLCHLSEIPRGASTVELTDERVDPPARLTIALDPALEPARNAEQRFERARRIERGLGIAQGRLAEAEHEAARLRELAAAIARDPPAQVAALAAELGIRVPPEEGTSRARTQPKQRVAYRTFIGAGGQRILVGKGSADNDTLTLTVARPHDHWLHTRGVAGAHVVVPLERGASIAPELLLDAAHLAVHFSKVRGEPTAEIAHTPRRFVRKPKGAVPGSVNVDRERVFVVRIEPARLARLLESERA